MQIEDYLYQKDLHEPLLEVMSDTMTTEQWKLKDRKALGMILTKNNNNNNNNNNNEKWKMKKKQLRSWCKGRWEATDAYAGGVGMMNGLVKGVEAY